MSTYCLVYYNHEGVVVCDAYTFHCLPVSEVQKISRSVFEDLPKDRKKKHKRRIIRFTTETFSTRGNKLIKIRSLEMPYREEYQINEITNKELNFRTKRLIKYITCNQYKPSDDMYDYSSLSDNDDNLSANSKKVLEIIFDPKDPISKYVDSGKFGSLSSYEEESWSKELNSISDDLFMFKYKSKHVNETPPDETLHIPSDLILDPITMSYQINYPGDDQFIKGFRDVQSLSAEEKNNYWLLHKIGFIKPGNHYIWHDRVILKKICGNSWGDFLSKRSDSVIENGYKKGRSERISRCTIFSFL